MLAWYMLSSCVRLSVCLSVTSQYSVKTAKHRITQTTPGTLVSDAKDLHENRRPQSTPTGAPNAGGVG